SSSLYLFLHSYARHRVLHSFPTRRSSDLSAHCRRRSLRRARTRRSPQRGRDTRETTPTSARRRPSPDRCARRGPAPESASDERADRKSTRLNSSHVKISYAVFCLKKKYIP